MLWNNTMDTFTWVFTFIKVGFTKGLTINLHLHSNTLLIKLRYSTNFLSEATSIGNKFYKTAG